jgi:hypothetical protein
VWTVRFADGSATEVRVDRHVGPRGEWFYAWAKWPGCNPPLLHLSGNTAQYAVERLIACGIGNARNGEEGCGLREVVPPAAVAAPARRSLPASLSAPIEPVTFPAAAVTDDVAALSAAGFRVWSFPPGELARVCTDGWASLVERAGYDESRAVERWYAGGHLVVACADRVPGAPDLTAGEAEEGGEP